MVRLLLPGINSTLREELSLRRRSNNKLGPNGNDGLFRWMGSIAVDQNGNTALGYSVSSSDMFPAIRYAGRLSSDPLNDLAQGEANMFSGTGAQTDTNGRWAIIV